MGHYYKCAVCDHWLNYIPLRGFFHEWKEREDHRPKPVRVA